VHHSCTVSRNTDIPKICIMFLKPFRAPAAGAMVVKPPFVLHAVADGAPAAAHAVGPSRVRRAERAQDCHDTFG